MKQETKQWLELIFAFAMITFIVWLTITMAKVMAGGKRESSYDPFTALDPFGEEKPSCPQGQVWIDSLPGCVDSESGFKWPRWLKITRSCPPGFVLDEYKSCVRPYQLN